MTKSSYFFAMVALMLLGGISLVSWQLFKAEQDITLPEVSSVADQFGLPGLRSDDKTSTLRASSAVLYDADSQSIVYEDNGFERAPVASLTKLMTAMVALDYGIDWDELVSINPDEYVIGGRLRLFAGEEVTMRDLWHASLLGSANNATLAYVRNIGVPEDEFIQAMNRKAIELGLEQTKFVEVTGLDTENISTAYEVAILATEAFSAYPEIAAATSLAQYTFTVPANGREHTLTNTNQNISPDHKSYQGSKTGYLYEAGYCLVVQGVGDRNNLVAVILGGDADEWNFVDIERLLAVSAP